MSAEPAPTLPPQASRPPVPAWLLPPHEGFTAEDLDRLPELPPNTELIDGSLILVSPQKIFHSLAMDLIQLGLRRTVPGHLRVRREITVRLGDRQRPQPDLLVVQASAESGTDATDASAYQPDAVELVVEVVSPESMIRDRERKPQLYAQAGIMHFWRVENVAGKPAVYVYELDPETRSYALTDTYHDQLKLDRPFVIDIDLTEIEHL